MGNVDVIGFCVIRNELYDPGGIVGISDKSSGDFLSSDENFTFEYSELELNWNVELNNINPSIIRIVMNTKKLIIVFFIFITSLKKPHHRIEVSISLDDIDQQFPGYQYAKNLLVVFKYRL
jgi:hypothetical protein